MIFLDNSRISDYRNCPRYYYFRHVRHWTTSRDSIALVAGSAWHKGMDALWQDPHNLDIVNIASEIWTDYMIAEGYDVTDPTFGLEEFRTIGCFKEMFTSYLAQHMQFLREIEVLGVEQPFVVPISETEKVFYIGLLDKIIAHQKRIRVIDHKTTSFYAKAGGFRTIWLNSFSPNSQIEGYQYAGIIMYGPDFDDVWVDAALVHKTVHDKFRFLPQKRSRRMLEVWLQDTNNWARRIIEDLEGLPFIQPKDFAMPCFPRNAPNSCSNFGRECIYKMLCMTVSNPTRLSDEDSGFSVRPWEPVPEDALRAIKKEVS